MLTRQLIGTGPNEPKPETPTLHPNTADDGYGDDYPIRYDYANQAWTDAGVYTACGHPRPFVNCFACANAGATVAEVTLAAR